MVRKDLKNNELIENYGGEILDDISYVISLSSNNINTKSDMFSQGTELFKKAKEYLLNPNETNLAECNELAATIRNQIPHILDLSKKDDDFCEQLGDKKRKLDSKVMEGKKFIRNMILEEDLDFEEVSSIMLFNSRLMSLNQISSSIDVTINSIEEKSDTYDKITINLLTSLISTANAIDQVNNKPKEKIKK